VSNTVKKSEEFSIQFFGMKFNAVNPGIKTIILLVILLAFFLTIAFVLKAYILSAVVSAGGAKAVNLLVTKGDKMLKWLSGMSP